MELAELRAAYEEVRKIVTLATDVAVWADLMHKHPTDPNAPPVINAKHLPGYVKKHEHVATFGKAMEKVRTKDPGSAIALAQDWMTSLHHIQNDDLIVSVAAIAETDQDAARDMLLQIAYVMDPDPNAPVPAGATPQVIRALALARINAERTKVAASLHLVKADPKLYAQYQIDQIKGAVFKSGAEFVGFLANNWSALQTALTNGANSINTAVDRLPDPLIEGDKGGLHAQSLGFRARMVAKLAASKR